MSSNPNPRCLAVHCDQREDERKAYWWEVYGTCSMECAVDYYGEEAVLVP